MLTGHGLWDCKYEMKDLYEDIPNNLTWNKICSVLSFN